MQRSMRVSRHVAAIRHNETRMRARVFRTFFIWKSVMTTAQNNHCIEKAAEHAFTCQDQMRSMAVNHACTLALARVFGQWQGCVPRAMNAKASALLRLQRIAVIHAEQQVTLARWWSWCARRKADSASRQHQMLLVVCRTVLRRAAMDGGWQRWKQRSWR